MNKTTPQIEFDCLVINKRGLHARAAAQIVKLTNQYECELILIHKKKSALGESLIKLLTLDAPKGSKITIIVKGKDAKEASQAINHLFSSGFGEIAGIF